MDILIAGGGIGGLTAALALHQRGHRVTVLESVREPKPLGVGINLLPHAVGVLESLGLLPALRVMAVETSALVFANRHGQPIHRDPRGLEGGYSHPQFSIHRGELQMMLWREASARLTVLSGQRVVGMREEGGRAVAEIETAQGRRVLAADLVIGADGIHSALRRRLAPDEGAPCWRGVMMWRGTSWAPPFLDGRTMVQAGHSQAKFVVYPIGAPRADGLQLINWIADRRVQPPTPGLTAPDRADWSRAGRLDDLLPTFGRWRFDWLDVPGLITGAEQMLEWPMVDRDPLPRWRLGRSTLLGDAAHPMVPIGSNGATQAIMDAQALAEALSNHADLETALAAYEDERRPLCARIVEMNRREGLDAILDRVEALAPDGFARLEDVIDPDEVAAEINTYKAAAGTEPRDLAGDESPHWARRMKGNRTRHALATLVGESRGIFASATNSSYTAADKRAGPKSSSSNQSMMGPASSASETVQTLTFFPSALINGSANVQTPRRPGGYSESLLCKAGLGLDGNREPGRKDDYCKNVSHEAERDDGKRLQSGLLIRSIGILRVSRRTHGRHVQPLLLVSYKEAAGHMQPGR